MDAVSIRGEWVGQVIDGKFPLMEWLGGSGGHGVFRTELGSSGSQRAAIKLIPASARSEERLAIWKAADALSHPHLLRIFHFGRAQIADTRFVYIVTELADEVLSQIIPERPLTAAETREMLDPLLDALGYLHHHGFVHGHVKPANILVVGDDIKLSSDGLLSIGDTAPDHLANDIHVAPETARSPIAPPADVWSFGITLVEALTQEPPIWDAVGNAEPVVPSSLLEPFFTVARECLHPDPSRRCTLKDITNMLEGRPERPVSSRPLHAPAQPDRLAKKNVPSKFPLLPLIIGLVLLVAIVAALQMRTHKTQTAPVQTENTRQARPAEPDSQPTREPPAQPPPTASPPAATAQSPATSAKGEVANRVLPEVPQNARKTIHGKVRVVVRVSVDAAGSVTKSDLAVHGPSAYFARLALDSARDWKFNAPQQGGNAVPSSWLLHYEFGRDGVDVQPEKTSP